MKVQVEVTTRPGRTVALTYEAPPGSAIGDVGTVPMYNRDLGQEVTLPATIVRLESDYTGPCKTFTPAPPAAAPVAFPIEPRAGDRFDLGGADYVFDGDGWVPAGLVDPT
jgi:hypothetical protein